MSVSVKNNPLALLAQLAMNSPAQGTSQGQGKLSLENAGKLLQMIGSMMTALKGLQDGVQGKGDSFGAKPGGAGGANGAGGAGGAEGSNPLIQQFMQLLQTMAALQDLQSGGNPQGAGGGAPGAGGGAPSASGGAPGAGGGAPSASGAPGAGGALPFATQSQVLGNIKQEQGALMNKIAEGVKSGKITPQELGKLMQGVQQLAQATKAASADGNVTAAEAANLQKMSMDNALNTKSAFENGDKSSFAAFNPATQNQAQQLSSIAQGLEQGTISNLELTDLAEEQGALAEAQGRVSTTEDATKLLKAQDLVGASIQLARLNNPA
jgi:hypothetical protein